MPHKCHVNIIIINTQGQIVQIYFIKKGCLTRNYVAGRKFHLQPARCHLVRKKWGFREGSLSFSVASRGDSKCEESQGVVCSFIWLLHEMGVAKKLCRYIIGFADLPSGVMTAESPKPSPIPT